MAILSTPSPTLYVSGLETKTKKPELRQQLYALFSPYGRVSVLPLLFGVHLLILYYTVSQD